MLSKTKKNRKSSSQEEVQRILPRKSSSQEEEPTKPSTWPSRCAAGNKNMIVLWMIVSKYHVSYCLWLSPAFSFYLIAMVVPSRYMLKQNPLWASILYACSTMQLLPFVWIAHNERSFTMEWNIYYARTLSIQLWRAIWPRFVQKVSDQ